MPFLIVACVLGLLLNASTAAAQSKTSRRTSIILATRVVPGARDPIATTVTIRVPTTGAYASSLANLEDTRPRFDGRYRRAIEDVLAIAGPDVSGLVYGISALPTLRIADGFAVFSATSHNASPWGISGSNLDLLVGGLRPNVALRVILTARGDNVEMATPLPTRQSSDRDLEWDFEGPTVPEVHARLSLSPVPGFSVRSALQQLAFAFVGALPFLLLLTGGLVRSRDSSGRRVAIAGASVALGWVAYVVVTQLELMNFHFEQSGSGRVVLSALQCLLPFAALSIALIPPRRPARQARRMVQRQHWLKGPVRVAWVLVVGAFAPIVVAATYLTGSGRDRYNHGLSVALTALAAALVVAPIGLATRAAGRWLALAGSPLSDRAMARVRRSARIAACVVIVAVLLGQLLLGTLSAAHHGPFAGFRSPDQSAPWAITLASAVRDTPFILDNVLINVLTTAVILWLSAELWRDAGDGELDLTSPRTTFSVALLFGLAVPGAGGLLHGYPAPIAFVLATALIAVALPVLAKRPRTAIFSDADSRAHAGELLADSVQLAIVAQWHARDEQPADDPEAEQQRAQHHADLLVQRQAVLDAARRHLPDSNAKEAEILEAALYAGSSVRERAYAVLGWGAWIVAIPTIYGLYSVIHTNGSGAVSADQPFGLAFLTVGLLSQLVMWPAGAWGFIATVPFIPGRHGVIKGAVASTAFIVPGALAAWVLGGRQSGQNWLFTAAELALVYIALGLLLDYRTLQKRNMELRQLGQLYRVTSVRSAVLYIAPLAVLLFTVVQGLATGKGASALSDLIINAPSLLPGGR